MISQLTHSPCCDALPNQRCIIITLEYWVHDILDILVGGVSIIIINTTQYCYMSSVVALLPEQSIALRTSEAYINFIIIILFSWKSSSDEYNNMCNMCIVTPLNLFWLRMILLLILLLLLSISIISYIEWMEIEKGRDRTWTNEEVGQSSCT